MLAGLCDTDQGRAEDKKIIGYFNSLIKEGSPYPKRNGRHNKSYKIDDYHYSDHNCTTVSADGLGVIGENWIGDEYDSLAARVNQFSTNEFSRKPLFWFKSSA